tara:strand:+ start:786 stop:1088 length:303 start_codon:yes stop_codon:yes gene_type:complete
MIIEYKLDAGPQGMTIPHWVKDGGYYRDPDNFTMVGWTNNAPREFKVPETVRVLDKAALITRVLNIHGRYPMQKEDSEGNTVDMTTDEVTTEVSTWYDRW